MALQYFYSITRSRCAMVSPVGLIVSLFLSSPGIHLESWVVQKTPNPLQSGNISSALQHASHYVYASVYTRTKLHAFEESLSAGHCENPLTALFRQSAVAKSLLLACGGIPPPSESDGRFPGKREDAVECQEGRHVRRERSGGEDIWLRRGRRWLSRASVGTVRRCRRTLSTAGPRTRAPALLPSRTHHDSSLATRPFHRTLPKPLKCTNIYRGSSLRI